MKDAECGDLVFDDGRTMDPSQGVVGIGADGEIYDGFDGRLSAFCHFRLTDADRFELALHMMRRWAKFGAVGLTGAMIEELDRGAP